MWNLKNKLVNTTKEKQTHRFREQTSGYQWGEGQGKVQYRHRELRVQTTMCNKNKLQRYIVQHREYGQYFIITINGV